MAPKSAPPPADRRIAALAGRQHGVVSVVQLRLAGLGRDAIKYRLRVGRLHAIHRGVYAVGHGVVGDEGRWLAAVLACGDGAVLSHRSAAALWGLRPSATAEIDVMVPTHAGRRRRKRIVVHRARALKESEWTVHGGIPVTTPARTALDLAATLPQRQTERMLDEAERLRLFDLASLLAAVENNYGHRGAGRLAAILRDHYAGTTLTRSELEERFLALCSDHGIPPPEVNVRVSRYEVDFLWREQRLIVETDGHASHGTRAAFERDRARDADLTAAGYRVVRLTYRQVERDAERIAALLSRLLR